MTVLHLGVMDIPYTNSKESMTTHEVAMILEENYSVMEVFFGAYRERIQGAIEEAVAGALESRLMGAPVSADIYDAANQQIEEWFKHFILSQEVEKIGIPGTPTEAALKGVSHRKKRPYVKANPRRPSFYDTGMYVDHFKAWITEQ